MSLQILGLSLPTRPQPSAVVSVPVKPGSSKVLAKEDARKPADPHTISKPATAKPPAAKQPGSAPAGQKAHTIPVQKRKTVDEFADLDDGSHIPALKRPWLRETVQKTASTPSTKLATHDQPKLGASVGKGQQPKQGTNQVHLQPPPPAELPTPPQSVTRMTAAKPTSLEEAWRLEAERKQQRAQAAAQKKLASVGAGKPRSSATASSTSGRTPQQQVSAGGKQIAARNPGSKASAGERRAGDMPKGGPSPRGIPTSHHAATPRATGATPAATSAGRSAPAAVPTARPAAGRPPGSAPALSTHPKPSTSNAKPAAKPGSTGQAAARANGMAGKLQPSLAASKPKAPTASITAGGVPIPRRPLPPAAGRMERPTHRRVVQQPGMQRPKPVAGKRPRPEEEEDSDDDFIDDGDDDFIVDGDDGEAWRKHVRQMFPRYDPSRFRDEPDDDRLMEASWKEIQAEERKSHIVGRMTDMALQQLEEKRRKEKMMKKKKKTKSGGRGLVL